jgi:hypothetical protein
LALAHHIEPLPQIPFWPILFPLLFLTLRRFSLLEHEWRGNYQGPDLKVLTDGRSGLMLHRLRGRNVRVCLSITSRRIRFRKSPVERARCSGLPLPRSLAKLRGAPFRQGRFYQPQYSTQRCSRKVIESAGGMRVVGRRWKKVWRSN